MARILLADDDPGSRDFVRRALETAGHSVLVAEDGADALAKVRSSGPFDVLLTDVQMPGLDGIALAAGARGVQPGLRIVMMSGYPDVLDRARATVASPARFVAKPFSIDLIRGEVRAALAG
jgi:CheY-like chemotaxis protein